VQITLVDAANQYYLKMAIEGLKKDSLSGSWVLVRVHDTVVNHYQLQWAHATQQHRFFNQQKAHFIPPMEIVAEDFLH
jgi:hypothetical protein